MQAGGILSATPHVCGATADRWEWCVALIRNCCKKFYMQNIHHFTGLYIKALANGIDEILSAYRQTLLRIEEEVLCTI